MYLPYLRGKQFELIALREFAEKNPSNTTIMPIIEPVKSAYNSLNTAIGVMFSQELKFALILNPTSGDFRKANTKSNILSELPILIDNEDKWTPAFIVDSNSLDNIAPLIENNNLNDVMLVFKNEINFDSANALLSSNKVKYILTGDISRVAMRKLNRNNKHIIRLDNCFKEQQRNADYLDIPDEKFTEEHSFYEGDGFYGISDYTALPKDFIEGGMLPYAIAIHITYKKNEEEIYVRHFVSDTNEDQSNIQKKFFEAASKVRSFFEGKPQTSAVNDLISIVNDEKYPGLGVIKKLSIRNHIELMNSILS